MLCAPVFAPTAAMVCSCAIKAIGLVCPFLAYDPIAVWSRFTVGCTHYFRQDYCLTYKSFMFLYEKLSLGIAKAVDDARL